MSCPKILPVWFRAWEQWRLAGGIPADRPKIVPAKVPTWAWNCYKERHPKPQQVYRLPVSPPVLFYRAPDDLNHGIIETLAEMPTATIVIDPLHGADWTDFMRACWQRSRNVYCWSRLSSRNAAWTFGQICQSLQVPVCWPNIEDDDLRAQPDRMDFLNYVKSVIPKPVGVLTNYNVSDEWPKDHPFKDVSVWPEWFPREIQDPTATISGSLTTGRRHFAASFPALDGRESAGLQTAKFDEYNGIFGVWPADNVTDWSKWK